jgi:hypothetical protein
MQLFAFFGLWGTLAAAAGAASIPIIIHLLNRKRFRIVTWAAMKFLLAAQKQNTRRMRLEQLILLALRVCLVLLIVVAMASVMDWAEPVWGYFWPEGAGFITTRSGRAHKIIVLDGSLSMNLQDAAGQTAFERAREMAVKLVQESPAGDAFNVILMKDRPALIVAEPSQDHNKVAAEIAKLKATHGNAWASATLNMVRDQVAKSSSRFHGREVYFFTDMQQTTWLSGPAWAPSTDNKGNPSKTPLEEIQARARTIFVDLGREGAGNLAVTNLRLDSPLVVTHTQVAISATVKNFGSERRSARVALLIGKAREVAHEPSLNLSVERVEPVRDIAPGGSEAFNFGPRFSAPGTYVIQVRLLGGEAEKGAGADDLDADNARSIVVIVRESVPMLVVNGKLGIDRFDQASEYLRLALNPFPKDAPPGFAPLRPRVIKASQFADAGEGDMTPYDCVWLCDVAQLGPGEVRRLQTHLRRGGGVVVSVGDKVADQVQTFNRRLFQDGEGIVPAQLVAKVDAPAEHHFSLLGSEEAFGMPPLKAFADSGDRSSLRSVRVRSYLQAKRAADARARTILSFMPEVQPLSKESLAKDLPVGDPAILEWNPPLPPVEGEDRDARLPMRYPGKVVLITTTLNMDWTGWPGSPSYGAMMQELARFAVSGKLKDKSSLVGEIIEVYLQARDNEGAVEVSTPDPEEVHRRLVRDKAIREGKFTVRDFLSPGLRKSVQLQGDLAALHWAETEHSGIYLLTLPRDGEELPVAVNVPSTTPDLRGSESDLTRVDAAKLKEVYKGWDFQVVRDPRDVAPASGPGGDDVEVVQGKLGPKIAHYLLLAVLGLLLVEVVLAWSFGHYSAAAGTTAPAKTTALGPALVAALSGVLFLFGAFVLIHNAQTGDFLGFVPDSWRAAVESWLNVDPPEPGEGRRWDLDLKPFLRDSASDPWLVAGIALAAGLMLLLVYRVEGSQASAPYKFLLGGLRLFLVVLTLAFLLPQAKLHFDRQGWPDVVLLIDDSRSMGEADHYQEDAMQNAVKRLGDEVAQREKARLPEHIKALQEKLAAKLAAKDATARREAEELQRKIQSLENQLAQINSPGWRPTRLQLAQALVGRNDNDWLDALLNRRHMKIHLFHLDANGRAIRAGDVTHPDEREPLEQARRALAGFEAEGKESRLGGAVRHVLDLYRGASLSAVIMLTDGVTTRDETLAQVADYAKEKKVPLFFVGIGDDHPIRDLKLHDLNVDDVVNVNERVNFTASLTGQGFKDLTVTVVLKVKDKDGKEIEVDRKVVTVDPKGQSAKVEMAHTPTKPGRKLYIMEVEQPKVDRPEKVVPPSHTRLERAIDVLENKLIRVLYVEGTPRYEFRFLKNLLERERPDEKKNRAIELKVVLLDADAEFPAQDRTALADFPATREELDVYDVIIIGDCDPRHPKLGDKRLRNLVDFVRGDHGRGPDGKAPKVSKTGGGLLMIAGPNYAPHAFRDTPLAAVLPVESGRPPAEPDEQLDSYRLHLTPAGRISPIRFSNSDSVNLATWKKLAPMYWFAQGYRTKPLAEILAVHPTEKAASVQPGQDGRLPLIVQHIVGSGRCMFFGFDETWRWRFRENEEYFNKFWTQTIRYLSRNRILRTVLTLDKQTPYKVGEPIKVSVRFPDSTRVGQKADPKTDVTVIVEYRPPGNDKADPEIETLKLVNAKGHPTLFEELYLRTREGKYRFRLSSPDVSKEDPEGEKPSADALVEHPPGELERLTMNREELQEAARSTRGRFYTLVNADSLLDQLPAGARVSRHAPRPPIRLWNHALIFALVLFLLSAEWILRKRKHLL